MYLYVATQIQDEARLRFERQASDAQHAIEARFRTYADVVHGVRALFNTSSSISRAQFHAYVVGLQLLRNYPGFQNINYAEYVTAADKAAYEARVRGDTSVDPNGYPNFSIQPAGRRDSYTVLTYQEPEESNSGTFGKDLAAKEAGSLALAKARDSGQLVASGSLIIVGGPHKHIGLALRLPVYRNGVPRSTVAERRAAYVGTVGAGIRVDTLMRGVIDEATLRNLRFRLFDRGVVDSNQPTKPLTQENLLFDSAQLSTDFPAPPVSARGADAFEASLPIEVGGRRWDIQFSVPDEAVAAHIDYAPAWLVLVGGLLSSVLLFCTLYSVTSSRSRAESLAEVMTRDLRESESRLADAQHMAHLGSWSINVSDRSMSWSFETFHIFGLNPDLFEPDYDKFLQCVHPQDRASLQAVIERALFLGEEASGEYRIMYSDQTVRWIHLICRPQRGAGEKLIHGALMDITERKLASMLAMVEHRVTQLVSASDETAVVLPKVIAALCTGLNLNCGVFHVIPDGSTTLQCRQFWNGSSIEFQSFIDRIQLRETAIGSGAAGGAWALQKPLIIQRAELELDEGRINLLPACLQSVVAFPVISDGRVFGVIECFSADLVLRADTLTQMLQAVSGQIGQYFRRQSIEKTLRYVAAHDALTDLPNRTMFNQALQHAINREARYSDGLAVLFIDLDRFKIVNDTLGHSAGDLLLTQCAKRLTVCLRESDIVARLGGDEFCVMVEKYSSMEDVVSVAQKILIALAQPYTIHDQEFLVTASIGISVYPGDGADVETLLKNSDAAMYRGKIEGNAYQFYSAQMNENSMKRFAIESSLRHAVEREELVLHYQPKVDLKTGRITGVEALLRWQHPEWGLVSPAQFIPVAEESGLIIDIGRWVLKTACEQNRAWQGQGLPPMVMAVNLSARQFSHDRLLQDITEIIDAAELAPHYLELEITESMVMKNAEEAIALLHSLKQMEVQISIDDFGTGYSSLAYLRRFPIDCVKIDRSFIKDIPHEADDMAVTLGIIGLAHSLRLKVIAEGIETQEQFSFLQANDCDEMQGYLFSKPLPVDQITALLEHHRYAQA